MFALTIFFQIYKSTT